MLIRMTMCAISLGGNLGDVPATFAEAIRQLEASPIISGVRMSRLYRTAPMGAQAGDVFWNAAAVFDRHHSLDVFPLLQRIEKSCGRKRGVHWGPRTLDLDWLLSGEESFSTGSVIVPHPAMWHRRFVLDPLVELIPDAIHPVFQRSIRELRERLLQRPLPIGWAAPASFLPLRASAGAAQATIDVADEAWHTAAIVFAGRDVRCELPQVIRLPDDEPAARQLIIDVLTAALDEPAPD